VKSRRTHDRDNAEVTAEQFAAARPATTVWPAALVQAFTTQQRQRGRRHRISANLRRDPVVLGPVIHPGEMLLDEFLRPLGLQQSVVADELGVSRYRLNELIRGKRSMTADIAIRLERRFKMPARFWLHLQADYDLQMARRETTDSKSSATHRTSRSTS
jgi:addiction module HigA family antidote